MSNRPRRPIDHLYKSINKMILVKVNRNRMFRGKLEGFDEHLNLFLENASQLFEYLDDDGNVRSENENLGSIVVRGDNVVFVDLATSPD